MEKTPEVSESELAIERELRRMRLAVDTIEDAAARLQYGVGALAKARKMRADMYAACNGVDKVIMAIEARAYDDDGVDDERFYPGEDV